MAKFKAVVLLLAGGFALLGLSGCDRLEQAANEAVEQAKQSAVQAIDEARQAGSLEEARQSADRLLLDAKQQAGGLLDQASRYLTEGEPGQAEVSPGEEAVAPVEPLAPTDS